MEDIIGEYMLGKKIENLEILRKHNFPVPEFITVSRDMDYSKVDISWQLCAVRSSASMEDGVHNSFAGQFDTYLNVPRQEVASKIEQCFASMENERVKEYAKHHKLSIEQADMNVMVQRMIEAQYSGVCFTANPQGILNEMVIVVGKGTGDNVVEDKVDTTSYYYNLTDKVSYYEGKEDLLSPEMIHKIVELASKMKPILGELLDIEFAITGEAVYILQARAITTLNTDAPLILDNSNIVESYPGLSLPLTCSFVNIVYSGIFKSISRRVLKNERELAKYDHVFSNMVGHVNGRIYYKISNWYTVIKFLPMNHKIIPIWQDMMGVKIKSYDKEEVKLSKWVRAKTYFNVIAEMWNVPKNMEKLNAAFIRIRDGFYAKYHDEITPKELVGLYHELHDTLLSCWDVTLLNDIYSFLFTGLVKKRLREDSNQVISGISNIESLKPIKEMIRLAYDKKDLTSTEYQERCEAYIREYGDRNLEELKLESKTFQSHPELLTEKLLQYNEDAGKLADRYHQLFQEEEGKETKPLKGLNRILAKEAARGIANREISRLNRSRIFGMVRLIFTRLGEDFAEKGILKEPRDIFWLTVEEAFVLVEAEKPNPNQSQNYKQGQTEKHSPNRKQGQTEKYSPNRKQGQTEKYSPNRKQGQTEKYSPNRKQGQTEKYSPNSKQGQTEKQKSIQALVADRKAEYELYACLPAYQRLIFAEKEFDKKHRSVNSTKLYVNQNKLLGTPCSDGIVTGEALVVTDVTKVKDYKDKILVTKMTDPGWVFLLVGARGVISEKGSLLSHTAIISRELKIPSIVGVEKLLDTIKTGDKLKMNGNTGEIEVIERSS